MLPSASGPPEGRILAEVRAARTSGGLGSRGGASWVLWAGGRWRVGLRTRALHLCVLPAATAPPAARAWPGRTQLEPSLGSWSGRRARLGPRAGNSGPSRPASRSFRPMDLSRACLPASLPDLLKKKRKKKKVDILEPGARLSRRLPGLAPGRVVPVVQLAIGRSPSNFSVYCPARLRSRLGERIDGTRGGRGCAARAGTVCWAA